MLRKITLFTAFAILLFAGYQQTIFAQRPNYPFIQNNECVTAPCPSNPQPPTPPQPPAPNVPPPIVTTGAPLDIGSNHVTLTGYVTGNGGTATAWFEYSTSDLVARSTGVTPVAGTANSFAKYINGLKSNTTYYYKICAQNAGGITCGSVLSFRTNKATTTNTNTNTTTVKKTTTVVDNGEVKGAQAARPLVTSSTWGTIIRSLIFLLIIIIALALAVRIFHSGH